MPKVKVNYPILPALFGKVNASRPLFNVTIIVIVTLIPPRLLGVPGAEDDGGPRHQAQIRLDLLRRLPAIGWFPAQL